MIVAVEGIDGAGKHTLVTAIARELAGWCWSLATMEA